MTTNLANPAVFDSSNQIYSVPERFRKEKNRDPAYISKEEVLETSRKQMISV